MINVFFVGGMFGTTIEYVLRSYTKEYTPIQADILEDGSMHSFHKEFHPGLIADIVQDGLLPNSITTPIYPFKNGQLVDILKAYRDRSILGHNVLLYADSVRSAELNMLFQYYKIATGVNNMGLDIFCGDNSQNIIQWNPDYTHWSQMRRWELREWFSFFYESWVSEWISSQEQVPEDFLKVTNTDMLFDTKNSLEKIIGFCGLTTNGDINEFVDRWQSKQQYIVDRFDLLDQIMQNVTTQQPFSWAPITIIEEAIIQRRLRGLGFEIRCDSLDDFPTNSESLYNLLEKC